MMVFLCGFICCVSSNFNMDVKVIERAGNSVRRDAKSEPLRNKNCGRSNCMCCTSGNEGSCETNSVGYRIVCQGCLLAGKKTEYEGKSARNAYSRGLEPYMQKAGDSWDISLQIFLDFPQNFRLRTRNQYCTQAIA